MTSKRKTRKSHILSVISILVCFSMLLGTTFAWFTDSVSTLENKIVAGNLDVELYHQNSSTDDLVKIENGSPSNLFRDEKGDEIFWEPGVVSWENFTVVNEGTLALQYKLEMLFTDKNTVWENGEDKNYVLSDALKVAVVDGGVNENTNRDDLVTNIQKNEWMALKHFVTSGELLPKDSGSYEETFGVVIYWEPTDDDNNWNVNNNKTTKGDGVADDAPLQIELGIKLDATQQMHESDSFGKDYDAELDDAFDNIPPMNTVYVTTFPELFDAIKVGGPVALDANITATAADLTEGIASIPVALYVNEGQDAVLYLNGYDLKLEDTGSQTTAFVRVSSGTLTIKGNGSIVQEGESDYLFWAANNGVLNINDGVHIAYGDDTTTFYASGSSKTDYATINVYGGTFVNTSVDGQDWGNVMNHGLGRINYYGGTYDWNPANVGADDKAYITVADGYKVVDNNDGTYTVVPE